MRRINLTVNDDNFKFLKEMKDSGKAASISHAARIAIQEYQKLLKSPTRKHKSPGRRYVEK